MTEHTPTNRRRAARAQWAANRAREVRARRVAERLGLALSKDRTTGLWSVARVTTTGRRSVRELLTAAAGVELAEAEAFLAARAAQEAEAVEAARQRHRQGRRR